MSADYNEEAYENALIELFQNMGWEHFYGPEVERDWHSPLYDSVLEDSIRHLNPKATPAAIDEALLKLRHFENAELKKKNALFMDYLQNGIEVSFSANGETKSDIIYIADFNNPSNNSFIVANQWTFIENSNKRPDILLFLNGLPICLFELKSPSREQTDASEAYTQIRNYMQEIPSMFIYNCICVMSDQLTSKAGTITSGEDRFMEWKTKDGQIESRNFADFTTFFEGIFQKERLLDIIKNFICFNNDGINSYKILAGYHQYFAVRKAVERTKVAVSGDGKIGVFWHTQGSGKSLSMVFYAHLLQQAIDSPTIVVITDRKNYGEMDVAKRAFPKFQEKLEICRNLFFGYDYTPFYEGSDLQRGMTISGAVNFIVAPDKEEQKQSFIKEALMLKQALSLCSSMVKEHMRLEAAFFESVRVLVMRILYNSSGKKFSLKEINDRINELLKQSVKSDGVINLFSDVGEKVNLFDPTFLENISKMKEKNLAVEMLKKLIEEQVKVYKRTNLVKSEAFSELIQQTLNRYLNGMLTNEEVIQELLKLAKEMLHASEEGNKLGLTDEELAFYDALTKPEAVKDFYSNEDLVALTKELTETLRKNKTIDWQKKESARAKMRMIVKKLLKKYKYPPEGQEDALKTVISQCELWTDNVADYEEPENSYSTNDDYGALKVAEPNSSFEK